MSPFTQIGSYRYWTDLLEPQRTSEYFETLIRDLRTKKQGYGAWMASRRVGEYGEFARQQKFQIHGTALSTDDGPVCSCGLVAEIDVPSAANSDLILFANPGHLDYANGLIVTCFYIQHRSDESQPWPWPLHFFCQICSALQLADTTGDDVLDAILLEDFRTEHKHPEETEVILK